MKIENKIDVIKDAQEDKIMQTSCDGCVFGKTQKNDNENLSDYCELNRLEKLKNSGAEIVNVQATQKDFNYKIINNRVCNMLRGEPWKIIKTKTYGVPEEKLKDEARKEISVKCNLLIYLNTEDFTKGFDARERKRNYRNRIKNICLSLKNLYEARVKPEKVTFVNNSEIGGYEFVDLFKIESGKIDLNIKWNMEYIKSDDIKALPAQEAYDKCVDIALKNVKSNYFCVFFEDDKIPQDYLNKIDEEINDNLEKFLLLLPEEGKGGLFSQTLIYRQFKGSQGENFISKMKEESKEQKCENIIRPLSQIIKIQ